MGAKEGRSQQREYKQESHSKREGEREERRPVPYSAERRHYFVKI
jgi:hypothetical protein